MRSFMTVKRAAGRQSQYLVFLKSERVRVTLTLKVSISIEDGVVGRSREVNVELLVG